MNVFCFSYVFIYSLQQMEKKKKKNQFHASGCFHEILFLTCSVPPWAPHLEDCRLSPVSGRPGMVWGALVPRGLARLWTGTAAPLSSHWSHSEYGDGERFVSTTSRHDYPESYHVAQVAKLRPWKASYFKKCKCPDTVRSQLHCVQQCHLDETVGFCGSCGPILVTFHL